jgi:uncharacterized protein
MALSMYQASVPVFVQMLTNLSAILDKAAVHAATKRFDSANYLSMRLIADMLPFVKQVQIACDHAKRAAARLANVEPPKHADDEKSIDDLKARIASVLEYLRSFKPAQFDGSEAREISFPGGGGTRTYKNGPLYLFHYAFPNFFFHVTTAYDILRSSGVEIGKADFVSNAPTA